MGIDLLAAAVITVAQAQLPDLGEPIEGRTAQCIMEIVGRGAGGAVPAHIIVEHAPCLRPETAIAPFGPQSHVEVVFRDSVQPAVHNSILQGIAQGRRQLPLTCVKHLFRSIAHTAGTALQHIFPRTDSEIVGQIRPESFGGLQVRIPQIIDPLAVAEAQQA